MSRKDKLLKRFLSVPKDFTYAELVTLLGHFGYKEDQIIVHDFSVDVKPGQKIAIVGPTARLVTRREPFQQALHRCQQSVERAIGRRATHTS